MPGNEIRHGEGSTGQQPEAGLARQLGELARKMQADPDHDAALNRITAATLAEIDGADYVGVSLIQNRDVFTKAPTDELVRRLDDRQHELDEGPCLSSLREETTVRCDDTRSEQRWRGGEHVEYAAAVALRGFATETDLRTAMISRDAIGQAKGILMERYKIDSNQAFDLLVIASKSTHRKLREVADTLAATGELTTK